MNGEPRLVSVVIPCYNQARYLLTSISSARAQTYPPQEVIVVDDGSSDDTAAVASAAGAIVLRQRNSGVSAARNAGLRAARGEFVVFLDADDELVPEAVETGVRTLTSNPTAVCAVGRMRPMDVNGRDMLAPPPPPVAPDLYREWLGENFVSTPGAAVFRRLSLHSMGGFPEGVGPAADYAIYLQLARDKQIVDHGNIVVRYRNHPESMSRDHSRMLRATMRVLQNERAHLPAELEADFQRGRAKWAHWYGVQIIEWVIADQRANGPRLAHMSALATLVRYCPAVLASRLRSRVTRSIVAPGTRPGRNTE